MARTFTDDDLTGAGPAKRDGSTHDHKGVGVDGMAGLVLDHVGLEQDRTAADVHTQVA